MLEHISQAYHSIPMMKVLRVSTREEASLMLEKMMVLGRLVHGMQTLQLMLILVQSALHANCNKVQYDALISKLKIPKLLSMII